MTDEITIHQQAKNNVTEILQGGQPRSFSADARKLRDMLGSEDAAKLISRQFATIHRLVATRDELCERMDSARRAFDSAEKYVHGEPALFNSLGILQGEGPRIDLLSGRFPVEFEAAVDAEADLIEAVAKIDAQIDHALDEQFS